jgi:hypothetical protein
MTFDVTHPALQAALPFALLRRVVGVPLLLLILAGVSESAVFAQQLTPVEQSFYANVHPYMEEPMKSLARRIPELKKLAPATGQQQLETILEKTGSNVDGFFSYIVDLIAHEQIVQERISRGRIVASEKVGDNYLILRHEAEEHSDIVEYRMDADGNRLDHIGFERGYLVTFGFALMCNYFSTAFLPESTFRYLGDEKIDKRDMYVVAFAQKPDKSSLLVNMAGPKGEINMLMQGIAWIDKSNFQITRLMTDLLAPHPEVGLERETTEVTFSKVELPDVGTPLWLPERVKVFLEISEVTPGSSVAYGVSFQNEHHYTDYHRYHVSVTMTPAH